MNTQKTPKYLRDIQLETYWPCLPLEPLALLELEKDPYYCLIPREQLSSYIQGSIRFGEEVAEKYGQDYTLRELINRLLQQRVRLQFKENYPEEECIRAQYSTKPATIEIYRPSMQQINLFFLRMNEKLHKEEEWLIHLYHEWFHHLEETVCGYTYQQLPKMIIKSWGPLAIQKPLRRTREIAAHAFTQKMMKLKWSPLLLNYLTLYQEQGWSATQIREYFQQIKQQWENLNPADEKNDIPS